MQGAEGTENCSKFIEFLGLRSLFPLFMKVTDCCYTFSSNELKNINFPSACLYFKHQDLLLKFKPVMLLIKTFRFKQTGCWAKRLVTAKNIHMKIR